MTPYPAAPQAGRPVAVETRGVAMAIQGRGLGLPPCATTTAGRARE